MSSESTIEFDLTVSLSEDDLIDDILQVTNSVKYCERLCLRADGFVEVLTMNGIVEVYCGLKYGKYDHTRNQLQNSVDKDFILEFEDGRGWYIVPVRAEGEPLAQDDEVDSEQSAQANEAEVDFKKLLLEWTNVGCNGEVDG
jgi:hypothetical protein